MTNRRATVALCILLTSIVHADPLSNAFDQGAALGRQGNQSARGQLGPGAASSVPGYSGNPAETRHFGKPGLSASAAAAVRGCAGPRSDQQSFAAQGCNAVDYSQTTPSRHPVFTIGPTDPLLSDAKSVTANPQAIAGNIAGHYSGCTVRTPSQSPVYETEVCHQARTTETLSCDKVLIVTPVATPGCTAGQFLTHVTANPCPDCIDYLAYDFTCGANGYVMHAYTVDKDSGKVYSELGTQNVPGALNTQIPKTRGPTRIDGVYCFETFYSQSCAGTSCTIGAWFSNPCQDTSNFGANTFVMPTTVTFTDRWDNQCLSLEARAR